MIVMKIYKVILVLVITVLTLPSMAQDRRTKQEISISISLIMNALLITTKPLKISRSKYLSDLAYAYTMTDRIDKALETYEQIYKMDKNI